MLVALAHADPATGDSLLDEYIRIQSSNSYVEYRTAAFLRILDAVLAHPEQEWVRKRLPAIMSGVLQVDTVQFHEGLPLAVLAMQAALGNATAIDTLNQWWQATEKNANALGAEQRPQRHRRLPPSAAGILG